MKNTIRLLSFLRHFWVFVLGSAVLGIATVTSGMGLLGVSADLIARAALHPSIAELQVAIVGVRFFGLSKAIFRYFERLVSHSINLRLLTDLRVWFYQKIIPLVPAKISGYHSADLMERSIDDIHTLENFYVRVIAPVITLIVIVIVSGLFYSQFSWLFTLVIFVGLTLGGILNPMIIYIVTRKYGRDFINKRGKMSTVLAESIQGRDEILMCNQTALRIANVTNIGVDFGKAQRRMGGIGAFQSMSTLFVTNMTLWFFLLIAIPLVRQGIMNGYLLAGLSLVMIASFESVTTLSQASQHYESCMQAAKRLFDIVDTEQDIKWVGLSIESKQVDICINGLTFTYPNAHKPSLENIKLDIPFGKHIGIVGQSGAGKSTFVSLVTRYWDVDSDTIFINRTDIRNFHPQHIRGLFGVLVQKPYIFSDSLRANMTIAKPGVMDEEIIRTLNEVGLSSWFSNLPNGLETWLGEHGRLMSGGERQRLAIGRLILQDAPIWLLDEAVAHLDAFTTDNIIEIIQKHTIGKTLVYLTHDLAGLEKMDEIILIEDGRIVEQGSHSTLLEKRGKYGRMVQLQYQVENYLLLTDSKN